MAVYPYFVLGPNAALSLAGLAKGPDQTTPTPTDDWQQARVDVVIPAFNEADTIVLCTGQESETGLAAHLAQAGIRHTMIGGAKLATELDAMRAIDEATRLAVGF